MAEMLELDAEVLHEYLTAVTGWLGELTDGRPPGRILDLGAGTGSGTFALTTRFKTAQLIAVDGSDDLLGRLEATAVTRGVADRVRTVRADLDVAWPPLAPVDLAWASLSMHHLAHPDRVLADLYATLTSGGLAAVVEMNASPRFLPDDIGIGRPGLEAHCQAIIDADRARALPDVGSNWGHRLVRAGFELAGERTFTIDPALPYPASAGRYARAYVSRIRTAVEGRVEADDLAALDELLADHSPHSLLERRDLQIRGSRTVWVRRRL